MRDSAIWVVVTVAIALGVLFFLPMFGMGMMGGWWPMMGGGMMGGWGPGFGWWGLVMLIFWVFFIIGIVLLVAWGIRQLAPGAGGGGRSRAIEILQERYARGEITREQYEQMRRDLEAPTQP